MALGIGINQQGYSGMVSLTKRNSKYTSHELQAGFEDLPLRQIAQEIAQQIEPTQVICQKYGVTQNTFNLLKKSQYFKSLVQEAHGQWNSNANAEERIKTKAGKALEDSIVVLYEIAHDATSSTPTQRLDAVGRMAKIAGMDKPNENLGGKGGGAGGFAINIVINPDDPSSTHNQKNVTIEATALYGEASDEEDEEDEESDEEREDEDFEEIAPSSIITDISPEINIDESDWSE